MSKRHRYEQKFGALVANPVRLDEKTVERIVGALNEEVASLFTLFHQLQKHHWVAQGPEFMDIHLELEEQYTAVHEAVDKIAERIVSLGGVPVSHPARQAEMACFDHEPDGVYDIRVMLDHDKQASQAIVRLMRDHVRLAREVGDYATEHLVKELLLEQEFRTQDLQHFLERESLNEAIAEAQRGGSNGKAK